MYNNYINAFYNGDKVFLFGGGGRGELYLALNAVRSINQSLSLHFKITDGRCLFLVDLITTALLNCLVLFTK